MSPTQVNRWFTGPHAPSVPNLVVLAHALAVPVNWLILGDAEQGLRGSADGSPGDELALVAELARLGPVLDDLTERARSLAGSP